MNKPKLLAVPHFLRELTIKADLNGVTILNEGRFRKRYTGSKQYAVDINGNLRTSAELKTHLEGTGDLRPKKIVTPPRATIEQKGTNDMESKDITLNAPVQTVGRQKSYSVNKPEVRARIFSFIHAQPVGKKELYFWTVTFPLKTSDAVIYRLFNTWLTRLRSDNLLKNYLWVAERQQNGTLHFHLAIPHKLPVKTANGYMRSCLASSCKAGEIDYSVFQCKRYNGVDIAKNRKERKVTNFALGKRGRRSLIGYITKYVTKNNGTFEHLAWHNSRGFSQLFTGVTFTLDEFCNVYKLVDFVRRYSAIKNQYFQFHPWTNGPPPNLEGELLKLNSYIQNLN